MQFLICYLHCTYYISILPAAIINITINKVSHWNFIVVVGSIWFRWFAAFSDFLNSGLVTKHSSIRKANSGNITKMTVNASNKSGSKLSTSGNIETTINNCKIRPSNIFKILLAYGLRVMCIKASIALTVIKRYWLELSLDELQLLSE